MAIAPIIHISCLSYRNGGMSHAAPRVTPTSVVLVVQDTHPLLTPYSLPSSWQIWSINEFNSNLKKIKTFNKLKTMPYKSNS